MKGSPNNLELLFMRPSEYIIQTEMGKHLVENRHLFLSKKIKETYSGMLDEDYKKLKNLL